MAVDIVENNVQTMENINNSERTTKGETAHKDEHTVTSNSEDPVVKRAYKDVLQTLQIKDIVQ